MRAVASVESSQVALCLTALSVTEIQMPPSAPRSPHPSTTPAPHKFDAEALRIYIRKLLQSTLSGYKWPEPNKLDERDRPKTWGKDIGDRVKERMLRML